MLVVVRSSVGGRIARRALLIQFKIADGGGLSKNQEQLYTEWPAFRYTRPSRPNKRRSVHPKNAHRGAQVGVIERCPRCGEPHGEISSEILHGDRVRLAEEFAALLLGGGGRELRALGEARRKQNWDRVVWDLISETTTASLWHKGFKARRRNLGGVARLVLAEAVPGMMVEAFPHSLGEDGKELRYLADGWSAEEGPPPDLPRERFQPELSGAVSTVFVDVAESFDAARE